MGTAQKTLDTILIMESDVIPTSGEGLIAPVGSYCSVEDGSGFWYKFGPNDKDWRLISNNIITRNGTTNNGTVVFDISENDEAIFSELKFVKLSVNDSDNIYAFSWVLSVDKKSLTVTVKRITGFLLGATTTTNASNGTTVYIHIEGE